MRGSRIWLSITALLFGVMGVWTLVSMNVLSPVDFGRGSVELLGHGLGSVMLGFFWLQLFFRQRGQFVIIGSRLALSASAFLLGAEAGLILMHIKVISPLDLNWLPASELALLAACTALLAVIWLTLFFADRVLEKKFRGYR